MASKVAEKRLQKEYLNMQRSPPPFIWASPEEKNILDWHFIIRGPPDTPYAGGECEYHGLIMFPSEYPFKPPDVKMFTPSGRFEVGHKICMSMTSYHPSTWNAAWSVATILTGLLSFMLGDDITAGAVKTTDDQKKAFAVASHAFNLKSKKFRDIFPKYATPSMTDLPDMGVQPSSSDPPSGESSPLPPTGAANTIRTEGEDGERDTSTAKAAGEAGPGAAVQVQVTKRDKGRWWMSWRMVVAVVILAIVGRVSTSLGI
ncbi:ubiquitin-conjugating enzyme/RWD-like protein [Dioszegia hungarica]|uniref:Ubiquitin-conjugating enzyme E2 6 n=1 Tax=Dioszegia hungarica TaxID=4972 RepID=A0AA38LWP9_9TREE|nr:ubiquitin-conjugating enzyme/RWD-like protein [Dioszegia hungarica]KAI9636974.1 ubiquitin-conjugating enzyme/RWD-like protein [Dioszegia hungarica]